MKKIKEWIARYLPAEIIATVTAILGGSITYMLTHNQIATAFAGVWAENVGFYGTIMIRDFLESFRSHTSRNIKYGIGAVTKDLKNILFEFGPSEILDSFVIRPYLMYVFPIMLKDISLGILVGKLAADSVFYVITILSRELTIKKVT